MKLFYRAVGQDSKIIEGLIEARDQRDAARYLRNHQLIPVKISTSTESGFARFIPLFRRSNRQDLLFFTRQLSSMLSAGLTLMQALNIMKTQIKSKGMADTLQSIIADVENGKTFSLSIEKYPAIFPPIYVSLVRTAETSGLLDKVLLRLADTLEKSDEIRRTIKGALIYPLIILILMGVVMGVMMIFVVPQLTQLYGDFNQQLPLQTLIVVAISNFSVHYWYIVLIGIVLFVIGSQRWYKTEGGRRLIDRYSLKLPIFGRLLSQSMMAEFTRTLGILVGSGSLVVDSLIKSADTVNNVIYREGILLVAKRVEKGIAMGDAMEASSIFPPLVVEMVRIGEQTGKLDDGLIRASAYYEREVDQTVKALTTLMEPLILVVLGSMVGFLVISIITPIYGVISSIK